MHHIFSAALIRLDVFDLAVKVNTLRLVSKILEQGTLFALVPGQRLGPCTEIGAIYLVVKGSLCVNYYYEVHQTPDVIARLFFGTSEFAKQEWRFKCSLKGGYETHNIIFKIPYYKLQLNIRRY